MVVVLFPELLILAGLLTGICFFRAVYHTFVTNGRIGRPDPLGQRRLTVPHRVSRDVKIGAVFQANDFLCRIDPLHVLDRRVGHVVEFSDRLIESASLEGNVPRIQRCCRQVCSTR